MHVATNILVVGFLIFVAHAFTGLQPDQSPRRFTPGERPEAHLHLRDVLPSERLGTIKNYAVDRGPHLRTHRQLQSEHAARVGSVPARASFREAEIRRLCRAAIVAETDRQPPAGVGPSLISFPDISIDLRDRIVGKAAVAGGDGFCNFASAR